MTIKTDLDKSKDQNGTITDQLQFVRKVNNILITFRKGI